jgi:1,4-alpha-glucan branching enzyme
MFWLDRYHVDGLRVPNGRDDDEVISLLRAINGSAMAAHPGTLTIAEESAARPLTTHPTSTGGLGFSLEWDVGWTHDALSYFERDPLFRSHQHDLLTFRGLYAFSERFVLPLSHDAVGPGKRSLLEKMPGDDWQKFANLRLLYAFMWAQPGKKLLFAGGELGQRREWTPDHSLDWHLLRESPLHGQVQLLVSELNRLYRSERALHELDHDPRGFEWIAANDAATSVYAFARFPHPGGRPLLGVFNCTPVPRFNFRIGAPREGLWTEILNTDGAGFGGGNHGNFGAVEASPVPWHGRPYSLSLTLPPLGALYLVPFN